VANDGLYFDYQVAVFRVARFADGTDDWTTKKSDRRLVASSLISPNLEKKNRQQFVDLPPSLFFVVI
jgi:hypothetical protein